MAVNALPLVQDFALTVFVALWVVVGAGDLSHQKIRHRVMLGGSAAVAAAYAALLIVTILGEYGWVHRFLLPPYYHVILSHVALCVFAALALWKLGVWPAGDAKLFVLIGALYPLLDIGDPLRYERLFLSALINTFLPAAAVLFMRACYYVYDTRLRHNLDFLRRLGWRREITFLSEQSWTQLRDYARELWPKAKALLSRLKTDPRAAALTLFQWLVSMLGMSLFSYYLKDFFSSPLKLTLLWTALFTLWSRVSSLLGRYSKLLLILPIGFVLLKPPSDWSAFGFIFRNLTLFSLCMFVGMNWAVKMLQGGSGLPFMMTLLLPFLGLALGELSSLVMNGGRWVIQRLRPMGGEIAAAAHGLSSSMRAGVPSQGHSALSVPALNPYLSKARSEVQGLPSLSVPQAKPYLSWARSTLGLRNLAQRIEGKARGLSAFSVPAAKPVFNRVASAVRATLIGVVTGGGPGGAGGRTLLIVCAMGLFFGLSLILVRLWDQEVRPIRSRQTLEPFLVLAPSFITRLKADPEFFETIGTLYPDGLTRDQSDRLKEWCEENAIDEVPLTPTMSFAAWIFLGFFVSHLLAGGHVLEAIF